MSPLWFLVYGVLASLTLAAVAGVFVCLLGKTRIPQRVTEVTSVILLIVGMALVGYMGDILAGVAYATRG